MDPESLSVLRFKRIHECLCALLVMAVIRHLLCRIRARGSLVKAGARAIEVGKRTIARKIGEKTLELIVGIQKGRRIVAVHRRPELLKCRVICHLVEGITRAIGQGHVPMLDLVSVFKFDGRRGTFSRCVAVRFASAVTTRAARRKRQRAERQNQNRREPRARASSAKPSCSFAFEDCRTHCRRLP